jgi:hypothetical protein
LSLSKEEEERYRLRPFISDRYSMGLEKMAGLVKIAQFWQLIWLNGEQKDHPVSITPGQGFCAWRNLSAWFVKGAVAVVLER